MAYCVNCGVKLEETLSKCPLCNTPVYPKEMFVADEKAPPYPQERGTVEKVRRRRGNSFSSFVRKYGAGMWSFKSFCL